MPAIELYCELWMCSGGESVAAAIPVRRYAAYSAWIHVPCQTTLPYLQPRTDPRLPTGYTRHRAGVTPQPKPARQTRQLLRYIPHRPQIPVCVHFAGDRDRANLPDLDLKKGGSLPNVGR